MLTNNNRGFKIHVQASGKKIRHYKDNCPTCGRAVWRRLERIGVGIECKSCSVSKGLQKRFLVKECLEEGCKNLAYKNPTCRYHWRRKTHLKQIKAREKVRDAVLNGSLKRLPCWECGKTPTHAHHSNYDKPLEVEWYCPTHHIEAHGGRYS